MKKFKKHGGFFSLLVKNYLLFTFSLLLMFVLVILFWAHSLTKKGDYTPSDILDYEEILIEEKYEEFPTTKLLGEEGYIIVLDENGKEIYNPNNNDVLSLSNNLEFIEDFIKNDDESYVTMDYENSLGEKYYELNISKHQDTKVITDKYILDEDGTVVYANEQAKYKNMNNTQALLLSQNYDKDFNIYKYILKNKNYLLIFQSKSLDTTIFQRMKISFYKSMILLLFAYIIMTLSFIFILKRKITKPLSILYNNIDSFEIGNNIDIKYKGPKEFIEIFNSFTNLADKLSKSEEDKLLLEKEKRLMLADIAHDLKTPITIIQGYSQALNEGLISKEKEKLYLETIYQKSDNLNNIINTFFEYSKLDHPKFILNKTNIDFCNYLRNYLADKYSEIELAEFILDANIPDKSIIVNIDKEQFQRVLDNIISNALKYNPVGTTLSISIKKDAKNIKIDISDNGVGIPNNIAENIFSPFVVGEISRKNSGTGLGLAIAEKIIDAHGGKIYLLQNNINFKTTFIISLPI